ncbi:MAG: hypothetical protein WAO55_10770 [Candidatus Manganitrophaceae bacterium]
MNPLAVLWILVFSSTIILSTVFYLAEHYSHIVGNAYFLIGAFFGSYGLYILVTWMVKRKQKKQAG